MKVFTGLIGAMALLAAGAGSARATDRFDLVCTGQMVITAVQGVSPNRVVQPRPFNMRYRFDLPSRHWCAAGCQQLNPIVSVAPNQLVLRESQMGQGGQQLTVNRLNGQMFGRVAMANPAHAVRAEGVLRAQCAPQPFSGFPAAKF